MVAHLANRTFPTKAHRVRCALVIQRPGGRVFRIDADNQNAGWTTVLEASGSDWPYAVQVADEILAIDADDPILGNQLLELKAKLANEGMSPVLVASGRHGRHHLFARIDDPQLKARVDRQAKAAGFDVRTDIRPPLSRHRHGGRSELLEPADPEAALRSLRPTRRRPALSNRLEALLQLGDLAGRYPSRSEMEAAVALGAVNAGWCFEEFREALLEEGGAGEKAREMLERGAWAADRYLALTWQNALTEWERHPPMLARSTVLDKIELLMALTSWPGRTGATDHAIAVAMLDIAREAGAPDFTASHRQIAERGSVSRKTVGIAVSSNNRVGKWVQALETGVGETATRWRLRVPDNREITPLDPHTPLVEEGSGETRRLLPSHDAFRRSGLGKSALQILDCLHPTVPRSRKEIASRSGRHPSTVSDRLRELWELGLARRTPHGWIRGHVTHLDEVAEVLGTAGTGDRQRENHERDREGYREYLEHAGRRDLIRAPTLFAADN